MQDSHPLFSSSSWMHTITIHHDDIYAESDCKYSEFYYLLDVTGLFWSISMFGILTLHIILLLCSRDIFSTTTTISKVSRADPSIIKINECHMRSWKYLRDATDNHNMIPARMSLQTKYRVLRQFELICCHYPGPQPSSHFEISSQQSDIFPPENLLRPRNATKCRPYLELGVGKISRSCVRKYFCIVCSGECWRGRGAQRSLSFKIENASISELHCTVPSLGSAQKQSRLQRTIFGLPCEL